MMKYLRTESSPQGEVQVEWGGRAHGSRAQRSRSCAARSWLTCLLRVAWRMKWSPHTSYLVNITTDTAFPFTTLMNAWNYRIDTVLCGNLWDIYPRRWRIGRLSYTHRCIPGAQWLAGTRLMNEPMNESVEWKEPHSPRSTEEGYIYRYVIVFHNTKCRDIFVKLPGRRKQVTFLEPIVLFSAEKQ
jgi:hypothetical protein